MSAIVERARGMYVLAADSCDPAYNHILLEMANEIARLRKDNKELQTALKFYGEWDIWDEGKVARRALEGK